LNNDITKNNIIVSNVPKMVPVYDTLIAWSAGD